MTRPPKLTVVSDTIYRLDHPPESTADKVKLRQFESKMLAREHIDELRRAMQAAADTASEVASGGDAYQPGVRDLAARMVEHITAQLDTLEAVMSRTPEPRL